MLRNREKQEAGYLNTKPAKIAKGEYNERYC
jgi:hypothetical protein